MKFLFLNGFMLWPMLCIGMDRRPVDGNTLPLKRMRCCLIRAVATSFELPKKQEQQVEVASSQAFSPLKQPEVPHAPLLKPYPAPDIPMGSFSLDSYEEGAQAPASPN